MKYVVWNTINNNRLVYEIFLKCVCVCVVCYKVLQGIEDEPEGY